jgi:hypothetical protein
VGEQVALTDAAEDAFADMTEAEEKWAQPDTIVWATTGAVSQQ